MMALQKAQEGFGQRWPRRANHSFQNLRKNKKRSRCESAFGFPLLSFRGYAARWRWALFVLASRFASPPYKPQGLVALRGFPGSAALCPIREGAP